ncbi:two-component sensor histidine kinase [Enterococcus florum]|uniref:histidine kinase n=1 Tax=Enterococcus florum TaxID=2480627 RepID=A0A4P5PAF7_9ENTE|nr:sensor histidine kinase [Enterococcus florum]GCF93231.1 two-component sensor histidine kinase [Enterococcus florum]
MTIKNFLKDKLFLFFGWLVLSGLMVFMIWLTPDLSHFMDNVAYLLLLQFFFLLLFIGLDYYRKREWYQQLQLQEENHLQQYLDQADSEEEKLVQMYINQQVQDHHQMMQQVISNQKDQKDYVDSWIHEIKVPLAAVDLILHSIEYDIEDEKFILLQNELQKIDEYVEQVLYYSRLDEFVNDYMIQEVSLKKIVQPVIKSQANYFIQKNLKMSLSEEDAQVLTDEKWVAFIFRQLLSNAIKYTPDGKEIHVGIEKQSKGISLSVTDEGVGIPAEDMGRIFDKGFTGENGRLTEQHATGLGLYLAKKLAEKLGVDIAASSEPGQGTTMTLFFPQLSYYQENR